MDQLGIKEWLYFEIVELNSVAGITEFRVDAVTDAIQISSLRTDKDWDYVAAAHSAEWLMDAIQDRYGR